MNESPDMSGPQPPTASRASARTSRFSSDSGLDSGPGRRLPALLAWLGAAVCVYGMRQADPDLWGYLAYGRLFLEQGGTVSTDPFSYTCGGCTWVPFEYLAQAAIWVAYHLGGPIGLIGLKCVVGGACVYFIFLAVRATTDDASIWVPLFLLTVSIVARYFLFRPQLFTFAFLALYVAVLTRYLVGRSNQLAVLPLVMLAWANLHGGFLAGLGAVCLALLLRVCQNANAFGIGRKLVADTVPLLGTLVASLVVTFVNPMGVRLWGYVLTEVLHDTNRRYIAEWSPTLVAGDHWSTATIALLIAILLAVGIAAQKRRLVVAGLYPWQWLAGSAPLAVMAYLSVRHVPVAAIWIAPVVALLASANRSQSSLAFRRAWLFSAALGTVPAFLTVAAASVQPWPRIYVGGTTLGARNPCRAMTFLKTHHASGNLYSPLWWGSYFTWQLYPAVRVSMDGRNISLYPDDMVVENLKFYGDRTSEADPGAPLRYQTDYLVVPTDRPVLERVRADTVWQEVYTDTDAVLFVRRDRKDSMEWLTAATGSSAQPQSDCSSWMR
jgi:hypothetical protein